MRRKRRREGVQLPVRRTFAEWLSARFVSSPYVWRIVRGQARYPTATLSELRRRSRTSVSAQTDRPPAGLDALPGVHDVDLDRSRVTFTVDNDQLSLAMQLLIDHGLRGVTSQPPTLEALFLREYGTAIEPGPVRDEAAGQRR